MSLNLKTEGDKNYFQVISKYSSIDMGEGKGVGKCAKVLNKMSMKSKGAVFLKNIKEGSPIFK